ncbi:hypothetical protein Tco_1445064, partial [Tanacetum coccineum]
MSTLTFADPHNMVAFLEKPAESDGFHEIINFLNANQIHYALTLQALVDKKRVIITESSIRSDLHLADDGGIDCLPTATILKNWQGWVPQDETHHDNNVPIPSNDPLLSGNDRMQLTELMILCTNLQKQVLDLEKAKDAQAKEIAGLKKKVQQLERKKEIKNYMEDASKQGRIKIIDEPQGRLDDAEMFYTDDLHGDEVIVDMAVGEKQEKSAKIDEREVSTGVEDSDAPTIPVTTTDEGVIAVKIDEITPTSAPTIVIDELTLAQTLIEIKEAKPKVVTTTATTTTIRPKARGVVVQEPSEFRTTTSSPQESQPSQTKDKGKAIMIEPEVPLKRKDQVALDEE